jgi:anti-sigma regulatory factor (Ser/Thr protein kinase)/Fe-S-cluster-containing hydrogenase component 2
MRIALSKIEGGDFKQAGSATSSLKKLLKKINIDPADMRRAIIAAFEAEMNVVIHAYRGDMRAIINSKEIEVEVRDEGPGIVDIELAMKEGFSTASPEARQLGYGAGLGLPNMKKNSDLFEIDSTVGKGTRVSYTIYFKGQGSSGTGRNSIRVIAENCRECLFCVRACPTRALRVHKGIPEVLKEVCIDCTSCIEACKSGALTMARTASQIEPSDEKILIVPPHFLAQFSATISPQRVLASLRKLGFKDVYVTEAWEEALRQAVISYASEEAGLSQIISPVCPAIVNLIALRFQSLIDNLAPFLSPIETARNQLKGKKTMFVAACPAQVTALSEGPSARNIEIVVPSSFRQIVQPLVMDEGGQEQAHEFPLHTRSDNGRAYEILEVNGMRHVIEVLEKLENGRLRDFRILELYACDCGCYGSPLFSEQPYVAKHRWRRARMEHGIEATPIRRETPCPARTGMRLSTDISTAITKLSEMEELTRSLPGRDCGLCGAPTCEVLAEDIVKGRATRRSCPYTDDTGVRP